MPRQTSTPLQHLAKWLLSNQYTLATAESCTGGGLLAAATAIPGSSQWLNGGIVSYTEEVKEKVLGVSLQTIQQYGVVSSQVAQQMALHALHMFNSSIAVATTGYAGPSGGDKNFPIGTVWIALATSKGVTAKLFHFKGGRTQVQQKAIDAAYRFAWKSLCTN